ncbi:uncharacterized protein [Rutidosis leptorrhynchoides]|uniref:uncharacterized protein n=1 Tax=Rutidosis leptorrhynchoides TaxID=125765 RepID=UPI003A99F49D
MSSPKKKKNVQSLNEKLVALTRFLSKAAERSLPFFSTLKNCAKRSHFKWTKEAEKAFQEMKALLKNFPTLTSPIAGETLILYLAIAREAFSSVLIAERDGVQTPIYFVSKAPTGSELNYRPIEKFVYALVLLRRLRRYFQAHPIVIQKKVTPSAPELWELYTDGASVPEGAEYEALLAGVRLAKKIGVKKIQAYKVLVEQIFKKSIEPSQLTAVIDEAEHCWMTNIIEFLKMGSLPENDKEAKKIRVKAPMYDLHDDVLYRKSYLGLTFRCVGPKQAEKIIVKVHAGACALHSSFRTVAEKIKRLGYYWLGMYNDAAEKIRVCQECQLHAPISKAPRHQMIPITPPWPFCKWAIDIVGAFPSGSKSADYLVVDIDFFTKWVEAKSLNKITSKKVGDFF